jgi:hypothetical protein
VEQGAEGCGLLRTEFLFLTGPARPMRMSRPPITPPSPARWTGGR